MTTASLFRVVPRDNLNADPLYSIYLYVHLVGLSDLQSVRIKSDMGSVTIPLDRAILWGYRPSLIEAYSISFDRDDFRKLVDVIQNANELRILLVADSGSKSVVNTSDGYIAYTYKKEQIKALQNKLTQALEKGL